MELKIEVDDSKKALVGSHGQTPTSGRIFVPKAWIGREVIVCLVPE